MSGHSKWSTIKRQKGVADAKRGQAFTKLSNTITVAVRSGGGVMDPESNFKLRLAVDKARSANMPKENIERAIQRAVKSGEESFEELLYEGFGPGGVAMMVESLTDNKARAYSFVKNIFEKNGGNMGSSGTVSYLFSRRGEVVIKKNGMSSDDLLGFGIEAGVIDMEEDGEVVSFYVEPTGLEIAKKVFDEKGLKIESAEIIYLPNTSMEVDEATQKKVFELMEKLEDIDDVQQVFVNMSLSDINE